MENFARTVGSFEQDSYGLSATASGARSDVYVTGHPPAPSLTSPLSNVVSNAAILQVTRH